MESWNRWNGTTVILCVSNNNWFTDVTQEHKHVRRRHRQLIDELRRIQLTTSRNFLVSAKKRLYTYTRKKVASALAFGRLLTSHAVPLQTLPLTKYYGIYRYRGVYGNDLCCRSLFWIGSSLPLTCGPAVCIITVQPPRSGRVVRLTEIRALA